MTDLIQPAFRTQLGAPREPYVRIQSARGHHSNTRHSPVSDPMQARQVSVASPSTSIFLFDSGAGYFSRLLAPVFGAHSEADSGKSVSMNKDHVRPAHAPRCPMHEAIMARNVLHTWFFQMEHRPGTLN